MAPGEIVWRRLRLFQRAMYSAQRGPSAPVSHVRLLAKRAALIRCSHGTQKIA